MSEFEPKSTEHCCKNCKWLNDNYVIATYPAQARCNKFEVLVSLDRTICLEDEEGCRTETNYPPKPESLALNPENIIKEIIKERENTLEERVKKIEEKVSRFEMTDMPSLECLSHEFGVAQINSATEIEKIEKRLTALDAIQSFECATTEQIEKRLSALETQAKHFANYIPSSPYELKMSTTESQVGISKTETTTKKCHDEAEEGDIFRCSSCHFSEPTLGGWHYCPNCGAKVDEEE